MPQDGPTNQISTPVGLFTPGWSAFLGGGDDLEDVPELKWPDSVAHYRKMGNDGQLESLMDGFTLPIRAYRYYLEPNGAPDEAVDRISRNYNLPIGRLEPGEEDEFKRRRSQRRFSFDQHLQDALRALRYGHYGFEQVGEYDGKAGSTWNLRKLAPIPPHTVHEIEIEEDGGLKHVKQLTARPDDPPIPVSRLVWYVWDKEGANWTGRSFLRRCNRSYLAKDRVMRVGAINIERAGGVPYVEAPEGASPGQIRALDRMARNFRVGQNAGGALPYGAKLKFAASSTGDGAVAYIKQCNEEMARAFLQMVNMLGTTNSGSRGLGDTFQDIAQIAQFMIAKWFCDFFGEYVIEDDIEFNEGPEEEFAPLLRFQVSDMHPLFGLQEGLKNGELEVDEETADVINQGGDSTAPSKRSQRKPKAKPKAKPAAATASSRSAVGATGGAPGETSRASGLHPTGPPIAAAAATHRVVTYKPLDDEPLLSTVYNVEVCGTGIEYPLASGPMTFTEEDLAQAVAAQADPAIKAPRVWLGHPDDDRFHKGRSTPAGSAEPAIGKLVNMRVEDDGQTIVADIEGCPTWLARVLSSAFPSRSIEGFKGAKTATGRSWDFVITDLALLGVVWPGVSTLDDLESLFSEDGPTGVEVKEDEMPVEAGRALTAQVNIDDVRKAFVAAIRDGTIEGLEASSWPWIRAMQLDPEELIVDTEDDEIFRVPFSLDGEAVTFGKAKAVKIKYVNAQVARLQKQSVVEGMLVGREVAAAYQTRDESLEGINQEVQVDPVLLRAAIGLSADATDEQVEAKLQELKAAAEVPTPDQTPAKAEPPFKGPGPVDDSKGEAKPESETQANPSGEAQPPTITSKDDQAEAAMRAKILGELKQSGMTVVPTSAWAANQALVASLGVKAASDQKASDEAVLIQACRDGKVFPHQREMYAQRLADPNTRDAFYKLLTASVEDGGLMAGLVPNEQRISVEGGIGETGAAYDPQLFPELIEAQAAPGTSPVRMEG